jgi:hypothetical protein
MVSKRPRDDPDYDSGLDSTTSKRSRTSDDGEDNGSISSSETSRGESIECGGAEKSTRFRENRESAVDVETLDQEGLELEEKLRNEEHLDEIIRKDFVNAKDKHGVSQPPLFAHCGISLTRLVY